MVPPTILGNAKHLKTDEINPRVFAFKELLFTSVLYITPWQFWNTTNIQLLNEIWVYERRTQDVEKFDNGKKKKIARRVNRVLLKCANFSLLICNTTCAYLCSNELSYTIIYYCIMFLFGNTFLFVSDTVNSTFRVRPTLLRQKRPCSDILFAIPRVCHRIFILMKHAEQSLMDKGSSEIRTNYNCKRKRHGSRETH